MQEASLLGANVVRGLTRCLLMAGLLLGMAAQADEHLTHGVTQAKTASKSITSLAAGGHRR